MAPVPQAAVRPKAEPAPAEDVPAAAPAPVQPKPVASAAPSAAPAPARTAVAAATVVPTPAEREVGMGNFGETYPARPVPGLLDALRAKAPHLVARITVDERGRATDVIVVAGADDAALRQEITRALLAATYIPASCNGLSCTDTTRTSYS